MLSFTDEKKEQIKSLYETGTSLRQIEKELKINRFVIKRILSDEGISFNKEIRSNRCHINNEGLSNAVIHAYYEDTKGELCNKYKISKQTFYRILKKNKVRLKQPKIKELEKYRRSIVKSYNTGTTIKELIKEYDTSKSIITSFFKKHDIPTFKSKIEYLLIHKNDIIRQYNNKVPSKEIAKQYKTSSVTIIKLLKLNNISIIQPTVSPLETNIPDIIKKYIDGKSTYKIAKEYDTCDTAIRNILIKNGIDRRDSSHSKQIYTINEAIFECIDTQDKAYWLGFLFADGHNDENRYVVRLSLQELDKDMVEKFRDFVGSNRPLYTKIDKKGRDKPNIECAISNKKISKDLAKLGVVQKKTRVLTFPKYLSEDLYSHFIRGYFDGDGSISTSKDGKKSLFSIAGTLSFLKDVQKIIVNNCRLNETKIFPSKKIHILSYGGNHQLLRIREWLYKDATIFMKRKKLKFDNIVAYQLEK